METVRSVIQLAVQENLTVHQMDVKTAFLHAPIDEGIYVSQPTGYAVKNKVWKLQKFLYGLKQSGRNWHKLLHDYLVNKLKFSQSTADPCLFSKRNGGNFVILLVWVDDIIIAANTMQFLKSIKHSLSSKFEMKHLGQ
jgi:Reverse transcriptase (RNA-dependent DNA polymerase).